VSFQERVDAERARRAEEEKARSEAAEREEARRRSAVIDAAPGCLDDLWEAVAALRADGARSQEALRTHRGTWERAPAGVTGLGGLSRGAVGRTRFLRRSVEKGIEFGGWWVRDVAFEFTIPLVGELSVRPAPRRPVVGWGEGSRRTVAEFVEGAIYRYRVFVGEQELSGSLDRAADEAIRNVVGQIEDHLVSLGLARTS
jgi:hypothetical protein